MLILGENYVRFDVGTMCTYLLFNIKISQIVLSLSLHAYTQSYFIYTINMKSVIALALVGSAAAFAPTTQGPVSTTFFCSAHVLQFVKLKIQKNSY